MKRRPRWVDNKYVKERVIFQVEADIFYRIKKHRDKLIVDLKKEIKGEYSNGNVVVKKMKVIK